MSRPIGDISRASWSASVTPASASRCQPLGVRRAAAHHADVADVGGERARTAGTSNLGSWVRMHTASRARAWRRARRTAARPRHDDLVGHREAAAGGEHLAGVAHRDAVAEHLGDLGQRGGEVDGAEDPHLRRRGAALDEHPHDRRVDEVLRRRLAVRAVVAHARCAPASSSASASRATTRSSSGSPSVPRAARRGSTSSLAPTLGPSTTVARATGCSARMRVAQALVDRHRATCAHQSSGSMNRWIVPPHVSPTANASSSL